MFAITRTRIPGLVLMSMWMHPYTMIQLSIAGSTVIHIKRLKGHVDTVSLQADNETSFHSYGVSLGIWDHTVLPSIWHKWTHPALTPAIQASTQFNYPGAMEGRGIAHALTASLWSFVLHFPLVPNLCILFEQATTCLTSSHQVYLRCPLAPVLLTSISIQSDSYHSPTLKNLDLSFLSPFITSIQTTLLALHFSFFQSTHLYDSLSHPVRGWATAAIRSRKLQRCLRSDDISRSGHVSLPDLWTCVGHCNISCCAISSAPLQ